MCSMLIGLWARRSFSFGVLNRINTCGAKQLSWASQIYCSGRVLVPFQVQKLQLREMSSRDLYKPAQRIADQGKNVWVEFTALAQKYKAVNLGQGMPDFAPPQYVREALSKAALSDNVALNQYTRSQGHPRLVNALGSLYSKLLQREVHPMEEILITGGAYESLYCAFHGILDPGDEVILIEPHFDCYVPQVTSAGGIPKFVPLQPTKDATSSKDWVFDKEELEAAFNEKTRMIVLNTPHNPVGKVFNLDELQFIANLCKKHNVICISDEVYEWLVFGKAQHIRIATLPGMWERTITIGSAGKTFSVTGWKLGWSIGPAPLIKNLQTVQANVTYTLATPTQEAVAECFEREIPLVGTSESSFKQLSELLEKKRDHMATLLRDVGFVPTIPEGGYFMMADTSNIDVNFDEYDKSDDSHDYKFVRWLTKEKGIATIPPTAFYSPQHKHFGSNFIRFCFMKEDSTLENAAKKLKEWQEELSK